MSAKEVITSLLSSGLFNDNLQYLVWELSIIKYGHKGGFYYIDSWYIILILT